MIIKGNNNANILNKMILTLPIQDNSIQPNITLLLPTLLTSYCCLSTAHYTDIGERIYNSIWLLYSIVYVGNFILHKEVL